MSKKIERRLPVLVTNGGDSWGVGGSVYFMTEKEIKELQDAGDTRTDEAETLFESLEARGLCVDFKEK